MMIVKITKVRQGRIFLSFQKDQANGFDNTGDVSLKNSRS